MSHAAAWQLGTAPARMPSPPTRPQLRLVGRDERMCVPARAAVRLTRRGRLLITLVVVTALTMTVMAFAGVLTPSASAATSLVDRAITVSAGQTLSEVAVAQLSNLPVNEAVARIQLANGLNSSQVHAGQSLLIPQMP